MTGHAGIPRAEIPVVDLGTGGFSHLVGDFRDRLDLILQAARRQYTSPVLWLGDRLSQEWAARADLPYLDEYAAVAAAIGQPGAWLLNFSYEWGCTAAIVPDAPSGGGRLLRTMDWQMPTLGRTLMAIRRQGTAGPWISLGWPGFVGTVQAVARGRFAAAINQAPDPESGFGRWGDWVAGKVAIWRNDLIPPALLLRSVFDECRTFAQARTRLVETPICIGAFFTLVGATAGESVVIERTRRGAVVHDGLGAIANHWLSPGISGQSRSCCTVERLAAIRHHQTVRTPEAPLFSWLVPPILNNTTRVALEAVPATGALWVRGYEPEGQVTQTAALTA
jgi:hypothetical protein